MLSVLNSHAPMQLAGSRALQIAVPLTTVAVAGYNVAGACLHAPSSFATHVRLHHCQETLSR